MDISICVTLTFSEISCLIDFVRGLKSKTSKEFFINEFNYVISNDFPLVKPDMDGVIDMIKQEYLTTTDKDPLNVVLKDLLRVITTFICRFFWLLT